MRRFEGSCNESPSRRRHRRPETKPDGAAGAGRCRGRDDRRCPRACRRRYPARPGARSGRRHGRQAERRRPARAARAAQPRVQPRATGGRRALRPADRRRRPALPGRRRAGRRRHRRSEDPQGRQPLRAPPAGALVREPHRLAHEDVDAQARDHEPAGHERRADEQGGQQSEHRCRLACRHRAGSRRGRVLRRHRRQRPATPAAPQPNWWRDRRAACTGALPGGSQRRRCRGGLPRQCDRHQRDNGAGREPGHGEDLVPRRRPAQARAGMGPQRGRAALAVGPRAR